MRKSAFVLMAIGIFSKVLGLARYITLAQYYGASFISDAYLVSLTIPLTIFQFIGNGISTTFIPLYNKMKACGKESETIRYINNLISVFIILCTFLVLLGIIFTPSLVKLFAAGFKEETLILAVQLTRITIVGLYFSVLMSILRGYLYANNVYIVAQLVGFPFNFIIITSIIIGSKTNVLVTAFGVLLAMFVEFIIITYFAYKKGFKYYLTLNLKDTYLIGMVKLSVPTIIGTSVDQINKIVDRTLASQITVGGISALNYANRLNIFVQEIFVSSITTVMYPIISKMSANNDIAGLKKNLSEAVVAINLLVIPATVGSIVFSEPIVKLLFGRGVFDNAAVNLTSKALIFYSIGMVAFGMREVFSRVFYSLQDTKTPMINAAVAMVLNIILNIILSKYMGISGLAFATSISAIICTALMMNSLRIKIGSFGLKSLVISFIKIMCASAVMGYICKIVYTNLIHNLNPQLSLFLVVLLGIGIYFILIYLVKIKDLDVAINALKNKIEKFLPYKK